MPIWAGCTNGPPHGRGGFLAGAAVFDPTAVDTVCLRSEFEAGRLQVMGEISTQYQGYPPDDPVHEPISALAESLAVPTLPDGAWTLARVAFSTDDD